MLCKGQLPPPTPWSLLEFVLFQVRRPKCWIGIHVFLWRSHKNMTHVFRLVKPCIWHGYVHIQGTCMLGGWVNPHREQQTIPQGQTSLPPKSFCTPTANGQSAPRTGSARGVGRRGEPHTEHGLGVLLSTHIHTSFQHWQHSLNTFHTHTAASMKRDRRKSLYSQNMLNMNRTSYLFPRLF